MPPKKEGAAKTNGSSKKLSPTSASSTPQKSNGLSIFVAVIAFFALGVLSPPSLHTVRHVATQLDLSSSSSLSTSSADVTAQSTNKKLQQPPHTPCTSSNLANYIHDKPVPGLHIVCIESLLNFDADNINTLRFALFQNAIRPKLYQRKKIIARGGTQNGGVGSTLDWHQVKQLLVNELGLLPEGPRQQPWAVFTPLGQRIVGENDIVTRGESSRDSDDEHNSVMKSNTQILQELASSGMVLVFQGGNWRWPGVREGFQRNIELSPTLDFADVSTAEKRNITIETLSMTPLVVSIKGFLTDQECDHIATKAEPSMQYSGVSLKDNDKGKAASNWRTSQSAFLYSNRDPILTAIDHRTASLSRVPKGHQEVLQVLRYGTTEKYDAHHDYFDPRDYQSDPNTMNLIQGGKRNRFATVFWYLTTVKEGGETIFPRYRNKPLPRGYVHSDCRQGLKVKPQKGKVIIFYSLDDRGQMDPLSLHGACPVIGEDDIKWAANKWIWSAPMGFTADD
eukprot:scaffold3891_cov124-Skeletonema_dohrnii-CCMP3373.AAC.4